METVLRLFKQGFLTDDQAIRAIEFISKPEGFILRSWEEAFLRAILIEGIGTEKAEALFGLPARSAKAIMRLLLQHHADAPRSCARLAIRSTVDDEEGLRVLAQASLNVNLMLIDEFNFTPLEARFFDAMMSARGMLVTKEYLMSCIYSGRSSLEVPNICILDAIVRKVRTKIKGSPFSIETIAGRGYHFHTKVAHPHAKLDILEYFVSADVKRLCGRDLIEIFTLAKDFGLSPMEARFVAILRNAMTEPTPKEYILCAMFFYDPEEEFGEKSFDVLVQKTNLKLKRFDKSILRVSGGGFVLL